MGGFAVEDMFLKAASGTVPVGQIMIWFGAGGALVFATLARRRREAIFPREAFRTTMLMRAVFEVLGRLFYTLAIILTPLSSATVILQAAPIVVVAGAALFFREHVGWRRWTAIAVGLIGVLVILQPGSATFSALSILAVLGMLGFAARDLTTRAVPKVLGTNSIGVWGFLAIVLAGALFHAYEGADVVLPSPGDAGFLTLAVLFGTAGYAALTLAMRTGEISAVAPFRYSRLLFGVALGILVFGESLDATTILGSVLVVAAGLYILLRGRAQTS